MGAFAGVFAAIMSLLIVVRHTREEEETGRQELLSSGVVGRRAALTAALLTVAIANGAVALLVAGGLAGPGRQRSAGPGARPSGVRAWSSRGLAAVAAQLTESARLARGLSAAAVGVAFVLRAAGDAAADGSRAPSVLTWLSPLGWAGERAAVRGRALVGAAAVRGAAAASRAPSRTPWPGGATSA